jgi:hypothetical protein
VWGRGIEEMGEDEGIHKKVMWDMENSLWRVVGGMEKDVCTWYVILMEDGLRIQVPCVALLLY